MTENDETCEQEDHLVPAEKSMLDLDDMVLDKILKHLNVIDLTSVAETCTRLEALAQYQFSNVHTKMSWVNDKNTQINQTQRVFKQCGKHVKAIRLGLWAGDDFRHILLIIAQQCKKLGYLNLHLIRMGDTDELSFDPLISKMFSKLIRFEMGSCSWTGRCPLAVFFGNNSTLEDLSVINCNGCKRNHNHDNNRLQIFGFRGLKHLHLFHCQNVVTNKELVACFENNDIQTLTLVDVVGVEFPAANLIDRLSDTLYVLSLDYVDTTLSVQLVQLGKLRKLKIFQLHCKVYTNIDNLLFELSLHNELEELNVSRVHVTDTTIEVLKYFKKLTRIRLEYNLNYNPSRLFRAIPTILPQLRQMIYSFSIIKDEDVIYLVKSMPKLNRLSFFGCNPLAKNTYEKIVQIILEDWHRPKLQLIPSPSDIKTLLEIKDISRTILIR